MTDDHKKRQHIRFQADKNEIAWISKDIDGFSKDYICLVDQESYGGCKVLTNQPVTLKNGDLCKIKVGELAPMIAEVRWVKELAENVFSYGFEFKE